VGLDDTPSVMWPMIRFLYRMSGYGREGEWILCTPGAESQEDIGLMLCGSVIKLGGRVAEKSGGNGNIRKG
jgi:hypothetical protein